MWQSTVDRMLKSRYQLSLLLLFLPQVHKGKLIGYEWIDVRVSLHSCLCTPWFQFHSYVCVHVLFWSAVSARGLLLYLHGGLDPYLPSGAVPGDAFRGLRQKHRARAECNLRLSRHSWVERERERGREREGGRERERERERENSNSKTLLYKDCSLGSVKTCPTISICQATDE